jgi:hypothetical protein
MPHPIRFRRVVGHPRNTASAVAAVTAGVPTTGAHRYWRVNITASLGSACSICELEFWRNGTGSKIPTTGGAVLVSGTGAGLAANLFDGVTTSGNYWYSGGTTGTAGYDFGSGNAVEVGAVAIIDRYDASQGPSTFTVQYSDDGSAWTTAWTVTSSTSTFAGVKRWFFDPAGGFIAWRVRFDSDASSAVRLAAVEFRTAIGGADTSSEAFHKRVSSSAAGSVASLFDGSAATAWAATVFPASVTAIFGDNRDIAEVLLQAPPDNITQAPDHVYIDSSPDGWGNWTNVASHTGLAAWSTGETRAFRV